MNDVYLEAHAELSYFFQLLGLNVAAPFDLQLLAANHARHLVDASPHQLHFLLVVLLLAPPQRQADVTLRQLRLQQTAPLLQLTCRARKISNAKIDQSLIRKVTDTSYMKPT